MNRERILEQPDGYLKIIEQWDHTTPTDDDVIILDNLWGDEDQS